MLTYLSAENMAIATSSDSDYSRLEFRSGESIAISSHRSFNTTSSLQQMPRSIYPIQIAQTEDNTLMLEGVGVIETLLSSEISPSLVTFTAYETIVLTTVSTSMICTCNNNLIPCELTFHVRFQAG